MLKRLLLCLLLGGALSALPAMAQSGAPAVTVKRSHIDAGRVFEVAASGTVQAPPDVVWKILTSYEHMPEFVPDMHISRVLSRSGNDVVVEQFGVARFLFIRRPIHLVVQVTEQPMSSVDISLIDGDMKYYTCRWEFTPIAETGGTHIAYTGKMVPKFYVPGMLGENIIRADIARMMAAVLARIDRGD